jgi:HEAT repeat protein
MLGMKNLGTVRPRARASAVARFLRRLDVLVIALALGLGGLAVEVEAHGGQFSGPGGGTPGRPPGNPRGGSPRGGGVTPGQEPTWRNWWDRNREEYFDLRARRQARSDKQDPNYGGAIVHEAATEEDIRKRIIPVLLAGLKDKNADVRDAAAIAIGRAGKVPELSALMELLTDSQRRVREAAMLGIGLIGDPRGEKALVEILEAPDTGFQERGIAAIALGFSGGDRAREALSRKLGAKRPFAKASRVKSREVEGCRALGLALLGGTEPVSLLTAALGKAKTKDNNFHPMVLTSLARLREASTAELAIRGFSERDNDVRRAAAILAGRVVKGGNEAQVKELIARFRKERDAHARGFCLIALGRAAHPLAVKELTKVLAKGKRREERGFAALALGMTGDAEGVALMQKLVMSEKDASLRGALAVGLGISDARTTAPELLKVLDKIGNPELRADLVTALAMLEHREALPSIRKVTGEARNERLVRDCGNALALMQDSSSLDHMLRILENSGSIQVKGGMASALGRAGDRRTIDRLVKLATDKKQTDLTRAFSIVALGLIGDKSPRSAFARVSIDSNYALQNAEALKQVIDIF